MREKNWTKRKWVAGWNGGKTGPTCPAFDITCGDKEYLPVGYGKETVAIVIDQDGDNRGELAANANLIAAAPDLFEALDQALTSMLDSGYPNNQVSVRAARQALKKARGEL